MFSGYFQGVFRVFSGVFREFQGDFRVFSACFQRVFPYALSGSALWTLSIKGTFSRCTPGEYENFNQHPSKLKFKQNLGDQFLSSAGTERNCSSPMRLPDPSPVLDKNRAPMGPEIISSTGAGVCRKATMAFPDSSSVLDKFQSVKTQVRFPRESYQLSSVSGPKKP